MKRILLYALMIMILLVACGPTAPEEPETEDIEEKIEVVEEKITSVQKKVEVKEETDKSEEPEDPSTVVVQKQEPKPDEPISAGPTKKTVVIKENEVSAIFDKPYKTSKLIEAISQYR